MPFLQQKARSTTFPTCVTLCVFPCAVAGSAGSPPVCYNPDSFLGLCCVPCVWDEWFHASWCAACLPACLFWKSLTPVLAFTLLLHSKFLAVDMQRVLFQMQTPEFIHLESIIYFKNPNPLLSGSNSGLWREDRTGHLLLLVRCGCRTWLPSSPLTRSPCSPHTSKARWLCTTPPQNLKAKTMVFPFCFFHAVK